MALNNILIGATGVLEQLTLKGSCALNVDNLGDPKTLKYFACVIGFHIVRTLDISGMSIHKQDISKLVSFISRMKALSSLAIGSTKLPTAFIQV